MQSDDTKEEAPPLEEVFGERFMTPYQTPVDGYDPSGVRSSWTTNEDSAG